MGESTVARLSAGRDHLRRCIAWDLDSTLADTRNRHHMLDLIRAVPPQATWRDYAMACGSDIPVLGSLRLMRLLQPQYWQVIITGRDSGAEELTVRWLDEHQFPADELRMRIADPWASSTETFKLEELEKVRAERDVQLVVEDGEPAAVLIYEHTDIPVLGVNPFYPSRDPALSV